MSSAETSRTRGKTFVASVITVCIYIAGWLGGRWLLEIAYDSHWEGLLQRVIASGGDHPLSQYVMAYHDLMRAIGWWLVLPLLVVLTIWGNFGAERMRMLRSWLGTRWMQIYFFTGLCLLAFGCGVTVMMLHIFPYDLIISARSAWRELNSTQERIALYRHVLNTNQKRGGVISHEPGKANDGLTLIIYYNDDAFELGLFDMDGTRLHGWKVTPSRFLAMQHRDVLWDLPDRLQILNGAHLYENGDLLFLFDYLGLVKVDRCSRLIWSLDEPVHHVITVAPDGRIWGPKPDLDKKSASGLSARAGPVLERSGPGAFS